MQHKMHGNNACTLAAEFGPSAAVQGGKHKRSGARGACQQQSFVMLNQKPIRSNTESNTEEPAHQHFVPLQALMCRVALQRCSMAQHAWWILSCAPEAGGAAPRAEHPTLSTVTVAALHARH